MNTKSKLVLLLAISVSAAAVRAQSLPSAPNKLNVKGQKEGKWIRYYNSSWMPVKPDDSIAYYDEVTFKADQIVGLVKNYYVTGALESEGKLISEDPWIQDSIWTEYRPDGQRKTVRVYTDRYYDGEKTADQMIKLGDEIKRRFGPDHEYFLSHIYVTNNILSSWHANEKNEIYLKRTLTEVIDKLGPESEACYCTNISLADFYINKGSDEYAIPHLEQAVKLSEKYPNDRCNAPSPHILMAVLMMEHRQYEKSKLLFEKGLAISAQQYGRNSREFRLEQQWYYWWYNNQGLQKEAQEIAEEMWKKEIEYTGSEETVHWWITYALARTYKDTGQYDKAEKLYRRIGGEQGSPDQLAFFLIDQKRYDEAYPIMRREIEFKMARMLKSFQFQSETQREGYYNRRFSERTNTWFTMLAAYAQERPECTEDIFNFHLVNKAILLNSSAKWKQRIKQSGDVKLINLYSEWERVNKQLSNSESQEGLAFRQLQRKNEDLEQILNKRSHLFIRSEERRIHSWSEVRDKLKKDEAAVEIIRYKKRAPTHYYHNGSELIPKYGISDTIQYAALVVRPNDKHPSFVLLKNGIDLEGKFFKHYMNCLRAQTDDNYSWQIYWDPVRRLCKGAKKIYVSTDGIYNKINLNTLLDPVTKKFLIEETQIVQVTSTKDLLMPPSDDQLNKYAILVGMPAYDSTVVALPGTKEEVEKISGILQQHDWTLDLYLNNDAREENIKDAFKPGILHIATHGFFHEKDSAGFTTVDMLNRSGLLLSSEVGPEDGVLTAYESMNLNLDDTELVVLSACETASGELQNSEGVYGLQRAFRVAGAKSLIMSLWKVNDDETRELMTDFYAQWLGGKDKVSSFRAAQLNMLKRTRDPMLWGGFVMLGR